MCSRTLSLGSPRSRKTTLTDDSFGILKNEVSTKQDWLSHVKTSTQSMQNVVVFIQKMPSHGKGSSLTSPSAQVPRDPRLALLVFHPRDGPDAGVPRE